VSGVSAEVLLIPVPLLAPFSRGHGEMGKTPARWRTAGFCFVRQLSDTLRVCGPSKKQKGGDE
jgi:hypothetical protein